MAFKRIKDWLTTITSFRSGDVIPVDGPSGTAKMAKDSLLNITSDNAKEAVKNALFRNTFKVKIQDDYYDCVIIGNKLWMAENLRLEYGTSSDSSWVGNSKDQAISNGYGVEYKASSVIDSNEQMTSGFAAKLPAGWRIPTNSDFQDLISNIGGGSSGGFLRAFTDSWADYNGAKPKRMDVFGFNALPSGLASAYVGSGFTALSSTKTGSSNNYFRLWYNSESVYMTTFSDDRKCCIRLVLDLVDGAIPSTASVTYGKFDKGNAPAGNFVRVSKYGKERNINLNALWKDIPQVISNISYSQWLVNRHYNKNEVPFFNGYIDSNGIVRYGSLNYFFALIRVFNGLKVKFRGNGSSYTSSFFLFDDSFDLVEDGGSSLKDGVEKTFTQDGWFAVNSIGSSDYYLSLELPEPDVFDAGFSESNVINRKQFEFTPGYYISSSGGVDSPVAAEAFNYTVIKVRAGQKIALRTNVYGVVKAVVFFDKNKNFVSSMDSVTSMYIYEVTEDGYLCVNSSYMTTTYAFPIDYWSIVYNCVSDISNVTSNPSNLFKAFVVNDLHGNMHSLKCVKELQKVFGIPSITCGDMAPIRPTSYDFSEFIDLAKATNMYFTIGQHECGFLLDSDGDAGRLKSNCFSHQEVFETLIEPMKESWGLDSLSTNYWYKDLVSEKVRLISLYQYNIPLVDDPEDSDYYKYKREVVWYGQEQIDWFVDVLANTPEDYTVVILKHQPDGVCSSTGSNFGNRNISGSNLIIDGTPIEDIVNAFMNKTTLANDYVCSDTTTYPTADFTLSVDADFSASEGTFGFYLMGDTHIDCVSKFNKYPQRTMILTSSTSPQDVGFSGKPYLQDSLLVNVIGLDSTARVVNLVRVGQQGSFKMEDRSKERVNLDFS